MQDKKKRLLRGGGRLIALVLLGAVLFAAPWAAETAITDVKEKLRGPQPEWTGVLSAGIVPSFPTVNLNGWLAARSREFEKQQGCVLLTLREMTAQGVKAAAAAQNLPDLLFFGQGVLDDPAALLLCMETEVSPRAALQNVGVQNGARYAVPLAAGAYGLLGDVAQLDAAGWTPQMDAEQTLRLCAEKKLAIACPLLLYTSPESALRAMGDVTGVSMETGKAHFKLWPDFVMERKYAFYVATQREVRRMEILQAAGKGFETVLIVPKEPYLDQVLLGGAVKPEFTGQRQDAAYRVQMAGRFLAHLLTEESQHQLSQAGLFPVIDGAAAYEKDSDLGKMEASLQGGVCP